MLRWALQRPTAGRGTRLGVQKKCSNLQNGKKYSQNTTIFISYEWVVHIAVYNYMFRPLSVIVRLYYFLL